MTVDRKTSRRNAFTLVEIMVVIAIIGLLVAVLLPAFGAVRTKARYSQVAAQFGALDTGLEMFRGEDDLGGTYPPSASDNPVDRQLIADPKGSQGDEVRICGAQLLVHAMTSVDLKRSVEVLPKLLLDGNVAVRMLAVDRLVKAIERDPRLPAKHIPALIRIIQKECPEGKFAAARVLGEVGDATILPGKEDSGTTLRAL